MRYVVEDRKCHFRYAFDTETGAYVRTGVLDKDEKDTGKDPFMASFPHLIDVGVMGHCIHGKTGLCAKAGIGCYQSGLYIGQPNMTVENFRNIASQCEGKCNQFALGGRGDPDQHEHFREILEISREHNIIPNFTTSGFGFDKKIADTCKALTGAVAVSWYRNEYTLSAIDLLLEAGVKTNIHYVLGNNSIDEAVVRLNNDDFPKGINAIVFLLHKPAGQGKAGNVLKYEDERVKAFFDAIEKPHPFKVGLDSCSSPGVVNFSKAVSLDSVDTCEGGRFSCYIGPDMVMVPCSFDQKMRFAVQLGEDMTIQKAWNSPQFEEFRNSLRESCPGCSQREHCMGGCPLMKDVVLCRREEKSWGEGCA